MSSVVRWKVLRDPSGSGWRGEVELPLGLFASARGTNKQQALARASTLADRVLNDPIVSAVLPPQAKLAVSALKAAAKSPVGKALRSLF